MDSNHICHLSPAKKMKCSFLDYVQLLMIGQTGQWTWTPSTTHLQPRKWNAHFWNTFNFWWLAGLVNGLEPCVPPLCSQKNEMLIFGLHSTSDDQPGWSMDSNPICNPSIAKKNEMLIFGLHSTSDDSWGWSIDSNPIYHLSPAKEMLIFGLRSTSDDRPGWSMDLSPVCHLSAAKKMKCPFLDYIQLLMIGQAGRWTQTPSATPLQPKKMKCSFLDYIQLLMISWIGQWTRMPSITPLQP